MSSFTARMAEFSASYAGSCHKGEKKGGAGQEQTLTNADDHRGHREKHTRNRLSAFRGFGYGIMESG
jgi:hypothetical protein